LSARLTENAIDPLACLREVESTGSGASLLFVGTTRDHFEGRAVQELAYEAYPEMAVREMEAIISEIALRWPGSRCVIVHRLGVVPAGEASVAIAVSTPHRAEAYEASRFAIDTLKKTVPIWKKEIYADGSAWKANPR